MVIVRCGNNSYFSMSVIQSETKSNWLLHLYSVSVSFDGLENILLLKLFVVCILNLEIFNCLFMKTFEWNVSTHIHSLLLCCRATKALCNFCPSNLDQNTTVEIVIDGGFPYSFRSTMRFRRDVEWFWSCFENAVTFDFLVHNSENWMYENSI